MSHELRASEKQLKQLQKKADRQQIREQYPGKADMLERLLKRVEKLENEVALLKKKETAQDTRMDNQQQRIFDVEMILCRNAG